MAPVSWGGARRANKSQHKILQHQPRRKATVPEEKVGSGQKVVLGQLRNEASATPPAPLLATPPNSILGLVAFQRAYAGDGASWCYRRVKRAGCGVLASQVRAICTGKQAHYWQAQALANTTQPLLSSVFACSVTCLHFNWGERRGAALVDRESRHTIGKRRHWQVRRVSGEV